jgi:hypothetical protein
MKIMPRLFPAAVTLFVCIGLSPAVLAQTSSLVSGNVPQDVSRINQDIAQLHSDQFNGNTRAIPQDLAFLHAQQRILARDQGSAQNFSRIQQQFRQTQRNFNNRNFNNARNSNVNFSQPVSGFVNFSQLNNNRSSRQGNRQPGFGNRQLGPIMDRSNNPNQPGNNMFNQNFGPRMSGGNRGFRMRSTGMNSMGSNFPNRAMGTNGFGQNFGSRSDGHHGMGSGAGMRAPGMNSGGGMPGGTGGVGGMPGGMRSHHHH